jgi:hypothetical protein
MYGDGNVSDGIPNPEVGIVATGLVPANQSAGWKVKHWDTVNTSQADPPTSFSSNLQNIVPGSGVSFTFVTNPAPQYTVGLKKDLGDVLTAQEAVKEEKIQFENVLNSTGASFYVVKFTSGIPTATIKLTAYTVDNLKGNDFIQYTDDDPTQRVGQSSVNINSVKVNGEEVPFTSSGEGVTISGVYEWDKIEYTTDGDHNRVAVENAGDATTAPFNVGNFVITQSESQQLEVGSTLIFEDDGPATPVGGSPDTLTLDESPLPTDGDGINSVTADFSDNFSTPDYGTDGAGSTVYSLELSADGIGSGLYALDPTDTVDTDGDGIGQGNEILLSQSDDTITGSVGGTDYFTISIAPDTGVVTFARSNNIWHGNTSNHDDSETLTLDGASEYLNIVQTVTDADGDSATGFINLGTSVFSIEVDGPSTFEPDSVTVSNAASQTVDGALDSDDDIDNNYGSDGPLTYPVRFLDTIDGAAAIMTFGVEGPKQATSNGNDIYYYLTDNDMTLVGATGGSADIDKVFEIALDPSNDKYTLTMYASIDDGSGFVFDNLSGVSAGNPDWSVIGDETDPNYPGGAPVEILVTGYKVTESFVFENNTTVNTNATDLATSSNNIKYLESLRLDFGEFNPLSAPIGDVPPAVHEAVNGVRFSPQQMSGNPGTAQGMLLTAIDAQDTDFYGNPPDNDPIDPITGISIYKTDGDSEVDIEWNNSMGDTTIGGVSFTVGYVNAGDVLLNGVQEDWDVLVHTLDGLSRLEIGNFHSSQQSKFSVGDLSIESINEGVYISDNYQLKLFDADGDSVLSSAFTVTWEPVPIV